MKGDKVDVIQMKEGDFKEWVNPTQDQELLQLRALRDFVSKGCSCLNQIIPNADDVDFRMREVVLFVRALDKMVNRDLTLDKDDWPLFIEDR